jgi:multidrug efflux pump subunit AcrB
MWLVNAALRRPYTVWVGMLLVLVLGLVGYFRTPTDILPNLKVPVVVVFASYRGMPAPDMEQSITIRLERVLTRCDHLEHIESRSLLGIGIIKCFFRSQVDPDVAASQVISLVSSELQNLPPGMLMPTILKYDATAIPVGNLVLSSNSHDDRYLLDLADTRLRDELSSIPGLASAPVFGGVLRQVQVFIDPRKLEAYRLSAMDVVDRVNKQSQVLPTGEIRIDKQTYYVSSNSMVENPEDFASIPIGTDGRKVIYLGDVADVRDAARWRTNTVRADGRRVVYMPLLRQAGASAVAVVDNVRDKIPKLYEHGSVPEDVQVEVAFDQSQYVRDALANLRLEALGGAVLASLVVLLFLGSIRTTWIVALAIPLSILAAFLGLYFAGMTINIMTLGGLALVLGRVIDDSIVDVENTVRHIGMGKTPLDAARDSAHEIAGPVLIATVTTVVVFLPLVFMEGVGKYLFMPMAFAAALALFASYIVSRTVSPLYCARFLRPHSEGERFPWLFFAVGLVLALIGLGTWLARPYLSAWLLDGRLPLGGQILRALYHAVTVTGVLGVAIVALGPLVGLLAWIAPHFDRLYQWSVRGYEWLLRFCLRWRVAVVGLILALLVPTVLGARKIGQELFPEVDASEFTIHMRATGGPRVEQTEQQVNEIERIIRGDPDRGIAGVIPPEDLELVLANIGINARWSAIYTPNNGPHAAFVRIQLRSGFAGRRTPTLVYVERLREQLTERFPSNDFFFETAGITRRILNAGAVAPIEVQVFGQEAEARRAVARQLAKQIARHSQVKDTYLPQGMDLPQLHIDVDRRRAALLGYTETDVVRNVIVALMSSSQLAPNFWIDPRTGNPYLIGVQYPEYAVEDVQTLENIPISGKSNGPVRLIKDVAQIERSQGPVEMYHFDSTRVSQLFINVTGNDLAGVAAEVERIVNQPPLEYALNNLPADKQDLADDEGFQQKLATYLRRNRAPLREEIRKQYGINPDRLKLPPGVRVEVRGEVGSMRDSFKWMAFSLALAVLLVYLVMVAQFQSWVDPLITIVSAPLGLIGVVAILVATDTSLNVQTCMGVLMMVGISVSNSVLVVEFANQQRETGLDPLTAVVNAARIRMRPILMTTIATIAGLLPMAIHLRPGDEMNLPLARAVIGGLTASTVLTLFVVPVLYVLLKPRGTRAAHPPLAA